MCDIADMAQLDTMPLIDRLLAVKPDSLSFNAWALRAGVNRTIFNDVRKRGNIRHDSLMKLLTAIGVNLADFESGRVAVQTEVRGTGMHDVALAWRPAEPTKPLPLVGSAFGGEWDGGIEMTELHLAEVLDYLARPVGLANDVRAYAVEIVGDSMAPRFEPGERAFVSPKTPVRVGDDIIVQLKSDGRETGEDGNGRSNEGSQLADQVTMVLIKRLVKRSTTYLELQQFNPPMIFRLPMERVAEIHRVKGRL